MADDTTTAKPEADEAPAPPEPPTLHGCPVVTERGHQIVHCTAEQYLTLITALKDDGYAFCSDVCAVDYLAHRTRPLPDGVPDERFEVVVTLRSLEPPGIVRVRCQVPESNPVLPTLFDLWPGSEAMEREVFDLMGIRFDDHPDLTRILLPEDWEGHPLRKDHGVGRVPVQFKGTPPPR